MIKVLINGVACPLVDNDSILVTKKITDIVNPEQKQIEYSKSFLLLGNSKVNQLFGNIFEVNGVIQNTTTENFTPDFNPNLKAPIVIMVDDAVQTSGYCQLLDIIIEDQNKVYYNVNFYSSIGNFFNDIKLLYLANLDFSSLDHAWTQTNIVNSWTPTLGTGYVYPMIDNGLTNDYDNWQTTYFRPALFAKQIFDKIFSNAGWSYSSTFLNSTRFKSLIIPFSGENLLLDNDSIYDRSYLVGASGNTTYNCGTLYDYATQPPILLPLVSGTLGGYTLHNTPGNSYNNTTGQWQNNASGLYQLAVSLTLQQINGKFFASNGQAGLYLMRDRSGVIEKVEQRYLNFFYPPAQFTSDPIQVDFTSAPINVAVGDIYYWVIGFGSIQDSAGIQKYSTSGDIQVEVIANSYFSLIPKPDLIYGDTISMNSILPNDIKQGDFIMAFVKMFNLYIEEISPNKLLIEPREDYLNSDIVDWTEKIHIGRDRPPKYIPLALSQVKRYKFEYELDGDYQNTRYNDAYKETYGTSINDIDNDFLTETKVIKPIFAATPLSSVLSGTNNRIISDIRFVKDNLAIAAQSKLRVLYWGGLINCASWNLIGGGTTSVKTSYPYAGHLDNPFNPNFDLCFGVPIVLFYQNNGLANWEYTDSNLYNIYWSRSIREFTNKNSKVLEAMFRLTSYDWLSINFRKQYFIKDCYYRLLEVSDYNIDSEELTKCILLKSDYEQPVPIARNNIRGGIGTFPSGGKLPVLPRGNAINDKVIRNDGENTGSGGYVTGGVTLVRGNNNNIPDSANNGFIFGSNGVTLSLPNSFVFNTDDLIMDRDGAVFNGVELSRKFEFTFDSTFVQAIDGSTPYEILPALKSNEYYLVEGFHVETLGGTVSYSFVGSGDITIKTSGSTLATIVGANWLGEIPGDIGDGTTTGLYDYGSKLTIEMAGTYLAGNRNLRFVLFYKIRTI